MPSIGTIEGEMRMKIDQAQTALNNMDKSLGNIDKTTGKLNTGMINASATLNVLQQGYQYTRQAIDMYVDATVRGYNEIESFNRMTGMSIEQAGKWKEVLEMHGMQLDDLAYAYRTLSNNIQMAINDPNSGAAKSFQQLGVSLKDANGQLKDSNTLILEVLQALQKVHDPTTRNALAADTLGRSYVNLNKLFSENIDLQTELSNAKTPYDEKGKEKVEKYKEAMAKLNSSIEDLLVNTGEKLIPMLTTLANLLNDTIVPAVNASLGAIEEAGRQTGLFLTGALEWAINANNMVADTFIGKFLGLSKIDLATLDNLRAMLEGTFQGANKPGGSGNSDYSVTVTGGAGQPISEQQMNQNIESTWAAKQKELEDKYNNRIIGANEYNQGMAALYEESGGAYGSLSPSGVGETTSGVQPSEDALVTAANIREQGLAIQKRIAAMQNLQQALVNNESAANIAKYAAAAGYSGWDPWTMSWDTVYGDMRNLRTQLTGLMDQYLAYIGFATSTPSSSLTFMAQGGIVTRPTIAMVGEAGAEAVVPLGNSEYGGDITIQVVVPDVGVIGEAVVNKLQLLGVKV